MSDALLFITMCIVDLPVDVHVKDGSVYTRNFYSPYVHNDYGILIVFKNLL
ncbi:nuclear pore complex DDB_G0274915-like isoform X2, partial [Olea europaea subsp. europaea]